MMPYIIRILFYFFALLISGILLFLAFPPHDLPGLIWIGLIPLIVIFWQLKPRGAYFAGWLAGFVYFAGFFNWILSANGYTLLHHVLLLTYLGIYVGFFGLIFSLIARRLGIFVALLSAPFTWIALEYVRSNLFFIALPMGLLAHTQHEFPQVIQISAFGGVYGVSFLIVLVNSAVVSIILPFLYRFNKTEQFSFSLPSKQQILALASITVILTSGALIYGKWTISRSIRSKNVKLAIVQGNIKQGEKWDARHAKSILQTYAKLTKQASANNPDLIIWPEAATPRSITHDRRLASFVKNIAESSGTFLLLGSSEDQKFKEQGIKKVKTYNSALLIPHEKQLNLQRYDKIRLFPFGEYLPAKGILPWNFIGVPNIDHTTPGNKFTIFETPAFRFAVTICWENQFPYLVKQFVRNGAQFIVNITNEAWFGKTAAPIHFAASSVFRAVENRVWVVRCANTGISCFIDPYGRIISRVKDSEGRDIFVRGILDETITLSESKTIYSRYGNILVWLSFAVVAVFFILAFLKGKTSI
jgi:apolipoprotein N-acyltransferase